MALAALTSFANDWLDTSFNPGTGANALVWTAAVQSDGKIVVGGNFTKFNGQDRWHIARLNANGSLDEWVAPHFNSFVRVIRLQPDGKIVVGGDFTHINGISRNRIARLNTDGSLDLGFDPGRGAEGFLLEGPCLLFDLVIQADGKIVIGGTFRTYDGATNNGIARLNADGSADRGFQTGSGAQDDWVRGLLLRPDGKIFVCGWFTRFNGEVVSRMILLNQDGTRDRSFAPSFGHIDPVYQMSLDSKGRIWIVGHFYNVNGVPREGVARLNSDGTLDTSFNPGTGFNGYVESVAALPDGRALVAGYFSAYNGQAVSRVALLNEDGGLDATYRPGPTDSSTYVLNVYPLNDGALAVGEFQQIAGRQLGGVAVFLPPGSTPIRISDARFANGRFTFQALLRAGRSYDLLTSTTPGDPQSWSVVETLQGDGTVRLIDRPTNRNTQLFYRLREATP